MLALAERTEEAPDVLPALGARDARDARGVDVRDVLGVRGVAAAVDGKIKTVLSVIPSVAQATGLSVAASVNPNQVFVETPKKRIHLNGSAKSKNFSAGGNNAVKFVTMMLFINTLYCTLRAYASSKQN